MLEVIHFRSMSLSQSEFRVTKMNHSQDNSSSGLFSNFLKWSVSLFKNNNKLLKEDEKSLGVNVAGNVSIDLPAIGKLTCF